jgi:pyruvate-formate lyase-activating enzyme
MSSIGHTGPAPKPLIHIKAIPPPLPSNGPVLSGDWPMFRISQYMQELSTPKAPGPKQNPPAPVVIWNLLRRCNLTCKHCYSISTDRDFPGELSTDEVFTVMDDLKRFRVPVLILSGGEPLLRPDLFAIARRAKSMGFYVGLSSNGTLIKADNIESIVECDFDYVGVSLDGIGETHDRFRQMKGAFEASLQGIRLCRDLGLKIGVRFTMTQDNAQDLPRLLELVEDEGIDRFYFSHLNYAGRGNKNRKDDAQHQLTRWAMDLLFDLLGLPAAWAAQGVHDRQQRCRRGLFPALGGAALPRAGSEHPCPTDPVGGQFVRGECRQHRQPRQRASRHHVVASQPGQRPPASVLGDLDGSLRAADGRLEGVSAPRLGALRRVPALQYLQRQHPRAGAAADRRRLGRGSRLLPRR